MSKAEILTELPKLKAEERRQIYQRLCELQEQDLLKGAGASEEEKKLLDAALAEYEKDRDKGWPWKEVIGELRARRASWTGKSARLVVIASCVKRGNVLRKSVLSSLVFSFMARIRRPLPGGLVAMTI